MRPPPLNPDDLETEIEDFEPQFAYRYGDSDDDDTRPPIRRGRGRAINNSYDDYDETVLPNRGTNDIDETQIDYKRTPRKPQGPLGFLIESVGPRRGHVHKIQDGTSVGRTQGDLLFDDPNISKIHAGFRIEDDQFNITDFNSENGTYVNGARIRAETPLNENDVIEMGDRTFIFKLLMATAKPAKKKKRPSA